MDCQSGCTVPPPLDSEDTDRRPRQTDGDDLVCARCRGNAHDALVRIPDLIEHIRSHVVPGSVGADSVHVRGTRTPPAPLSLAAVDDADDIHATLAAWCTDVMDGRDLTGPSWRGTLILPASKRTRAPGRHTSGCTRCVCLASPQHLGPHLPTCTGRRCAGCGTAYDAPRAFGLAAGATHATAVLVAWITPHLAWIYEQPWAAGFVAEVTQKVAIIGSRWPVEERPTRCAAPCPACDRLTLIRYAPQWHTGPVSIRCTAADCGEPLDERLYGHYVRVLADTYGGAA